MAHPLWREARGGAAALLAGGPKLLSSQAPSPPVEHFISLWLNRWRLQLFLLLFCCIFTTSNMLNKEIESVSNTLPHSPSHVFFFNILQCFFMIFQTLWEACLFFFFQNFFKQIIFDFWCPNELTWTVQPHSYSHIRSTFMLLKCFWCRQTKGNQSLC